MPPLRRIAFFLFVGLVALGLSGMPSWLHMRSVYQTEGIAHAHVDGHAHCSGHCPAHSGTPASPADLSGHSPADGPKDPPHDSKRCDTCQILGALKANEPVLSVFYADWSLFVAKAPPFCEGTVFAAPTRRLPPCRASPRPF